MLNNKGLGTYGEQAAVNYIRKLGYNILETNYRLRMGEIDIIAIDDDTIAFIEVKTRSSEKFGQPCESVNYNKQQKIIKTALYFITQRSLTDYMSRFDIIEVFVESDNTISNIKLIKNAFEYSGRYGY